MGPNKVRMNMGVPRALDGGPQCRLSILRNAHVPCNYFFNFHVDFKKALCRMSKLINTLFQVVYFYSRVTRLYVACHFYEMAMLPY